MVIFQILISNVIIEDWIAYKHEDSNVSAHADDENGKQKHFKKRRRREKLQLKEFVD